MEQSKSKDHTAHARDPKFPYFDDSKDKMNSYLSRFRLNFILFKYNNTMQFMNAIQTIDTIISKMDTEKKVNDLFESVSQYF